MIYHPANRAKKSPSQTARSSRRGRRSTTGLARIFVLVVFAALAVTALSFPSFRKLSPSPLPQPATVTPVDVRNDAVADANDLSLKVKTLLAERNRELAFSSHAPTMFVPAPQAQPDPTVSFFEADCTTPRSIFNPGDTVCARIDGLNTGVFTITHFDWSNQDGEIKANSTDITADGQTRKFTLAPDAGVGGWQANIIDQGNTIRAVGNFTVSDPENPAVDLSLNDDGPLKVTAGNDITFTVVLFNNGPDAAQNVVLTDAIPANTTFVSINQSTGPIFTCTGDSGATVCTIAIMPANDVAIFSITYNVASGTPADTLITNTATVSNTVNDLNPADNEDSAETPVTAAPCSVGCPENITVQADAGQAGAVVTYEAPTSSGSCGEPPPGESIVSCSQDSGTFFPVGTTLVTCSGPSGDACHFSVTVDNPGGLSISLNGPNPMTAECGSGFNGGSGFNDPGATAINASGQSIPVTVTGNVDVGTGGSYTLTYTATEGENSISTTRTVTVTDTTKPVITIDGANPYQIQQGSCLPFIDPGASATDGCAGIVAVSRSITGPGGLTTVDPNMPGTYTITYSATDGTLSATATRTVLVGNFPPDEVDQPSATGAPTITLNGAAEMTVECGSFTDPGATATTCGGSVPVTTSGTVPNEPGTYTITYSATDNGQTAETHRIVTVQDTIAPVITLNGAATLEVECHSTYTDAGATASDACAGSVPVTTSGTVDPNTPGTYTITYTATDGTHAATPIVRTVNVVDTLAPVITLNGDNTATVECHTSYTDPGATAFDACLNASVPVTTSGSVDVNTPGTYTITYTATDGGRTSTATRVVTVVDTIPPTITINGANPVTVECHTSYTDAGATASDSCAGSLAVTTSGSVNVNIPGTYTITYTATDGPHTTTATRSVVVLDTIAPVITLKTTPITLWPPDHKYRTINVTDLVQSVTDSCDVNLGIGSVVIAKVTSDEQENNDGDGNTVNDIVIGANCNSVQLRSERSGNGNGRVYSITLRVKDASGNAGTAVFKVTVPKNQGNGGVAVDSGPQYTVAGNCP
jgi:uncharacterized repeat protein (TIGR01451 family)